MNPVIIIGSPRSGTTLTAQLLESLGLFVGADLSRTHEPRFFTRLNGWVYREAGATLFRPGPMREVLDHAYGREVTTEFLRSRLSAPEAAGFAGKQRFGRYGSLQHFDFPWGWKDPRTTFTLPSWLELFPSAPVIHVHRHGVDVANSHINLYGIELQQMVDNYEESWRRGARLAHRVRKQLKRPRKTRPERRLCSSYPEGAFSIWEAYIEEARRHVNALGSQAFEMKYEDLLAEPHRMLEALAQFCGLDATPERVEEAAKKVKSSRAYAYHADPVSREFAERVADRLEKYGYSAADEALSQASAAA